MLDKTAMIFNPFNDDEFTEMLKTPDEAANLIFRNTPHHDDRPNGFTSRLD